MVFATAVRLLGSPADAEDAAQTVFLRAFQRYDEVVASPAAAGWLKTSGSRLVATPEGRAALPVMAGLTGSYLDAYRLVVKTMQAQPKLAGKDLVTRLVAEGEKALLLGELTRREAISRPYFESAVTPGQAVFVERGGIEIARNVGSEPYHEFIIELKD